MRKNKGIFYFNIILTILLIFTSLFISNSKTANAEEKKYYLGGYVAGFVLDEQGAKILNITDVIADNGIFSPAQDAGLKEYDTIISINGKKVNNCLDIDKELLKNGNKEIVLEVIRNNEKILKNITPIKDFSGKYKLGLIIRDALSGIGTITYTTSSGEFSALGHPIYDNKEVFNVYSGKLFPCMVIGVVKGKRGCPGEIKGVFSEKDAIGEIQNNGLNGIKGTIKNNKGREVELGIAEPGKASIYCCLEDYGVKEYAISIIKCDGNNKHNKNYVIKVTDEELVNKTGGIVQGMSGSPIVQNGKLVGAVTHVFVNDPTKGYGINIDNLICNK